MVKTLVPDTKVFSFQLDTRGGAEDDFAILTTIGTPGLVLVNKPSMLQPDRKKTGQLPCYRTLRYCNRPSPQKTIADALEQIGDRYGAIVVADDDNRLLGVFRQVICAKISTVTSLIPLGEIRTASLSPSDIDLTIRAFPRIRAH